ncbi:DUF3048 domain-containing protein [Isoptericola cucumis]|uniref:DUF3048 domain-containing protein n=1 Tax=Isoptericola cucumis TaxID=1776856 RepID=A0ABQ2BA10_9MICO|nr:DUF3048 domain-containing protein [Isoptericola cucumis]GGI11555.1 hypothetical protein GCM10007368_36780 [Isoptericola cucumis]
MPAPHARRAARRGTLRARGAVAVAAALALLATAGCSPGADQAPTVTVAPDPAVPKSAPPEPVPPPKPKPKPVVWPLTGGKTGTKKVPRRASVAVKIENSPVSRPHTGLHRADIVWEQVVEGGISRFVAVYHSDLPKAVGPVRSVRPMDPAIVAPMRGILAYTGGQPPFIRAVTEANVQSVLMDRGSPGFHRSGARLAPHNVYGNVRTFAAQAGKGRAKPPAAQFHYARSYGKGSTSEGRKVRTADVRLSAAQRTVWTWSATAKKYARSDGGTPSVSSGRRVAARNVLLMSTRVVNTGYRDPGGAPVPKTQMVGKGKGVLLSAGRAIPVTWKKKSEREPVRLRTGGGDPVLLNPGNLWVELVPRGDGSWRLP